MGPWAEGLAAQRKREEERDARIQKHNEKFEKVFLERDIKEIINCEPKERNISAQNMYFLCLRQILLNQRASLLDNEQKAMAASDTRLLVRDLEQFMLRSEKSNGKEET